jgi:hypothetical protein
MIVKLKIDKPASSGTIKVELTTDTSKRPLVREMTKAEASMLRDLLDTAIRSDAAFRFELEV